MIDDLSSLFILFVQLSIHLSCCLISLNSRATVNSFTKEICIRP